MKVCVSMTLSDIFHQFPFESLSASIWKWRKRIQSKREMKQKLKFFFVLIKLNFLLLFFFSFVGLGKFYVTFLPWQVDQIKDKVYGCDCGALREPSPQNLSHARSFKIFSTSSPQKPFKVQIRKFLLHFHLLHFYVYTFELKFYFIIIFGTGAVGRVFITWNSTERNAR